MDGTEPSDHGATPVSVASDFDPGSGALMLVLALTLWIRIRAF